MDMFTTIGIGWMLSVLRQTPLLCNIIGDKHVSKLVFETPYGEIEVKPSDVIKVQVHLD